MKDAKYTKGPWTVADKEELENAEPMQEPFGIWSMDEDEQLKVRVASVTTTDPEITGEQIRGNAHLIAAAPEILESLIELVKCWPVSQLSNFKGPIENAKAAIKKAQGQ